jgi:hypothetical protein
MPTGLDLLNEADSLDLLNRADQPAESFGQRAVATAKFLGSELVQGLAPSRMIEMGREVVARPGETIGAVGGATLGGLTAGPSGAMVGGAGGARLGHAIDQAFAGEPVEEGLTEAGLFGALGPATGRAVQLGGRILARVPGQRGAQRIIGQEAARQEAAQAGEMLKKTVGAVRADLRKLEAARNGVREGFADLPSDHPMRSEMQQTLREADDAVARGTKELMRTLHDPRAAIEHARAQVARSGGITGVSAAALGAFTGSVFGGLESVVAGGSLGYMFGRLEGRLAERLASNRAFIRWATGLKGQTLNDAVSSFLTQVHVADNPDLTEFAGDLVDFAAGVAAGAFVTSQTGSNVLGGAAGVGTATTMEEARHLGAELLDEGQRVWDELFGAGDAKGAGMFPELPPQQFDAQRFQAPPRGVAMAHPGQGRPLEPTPPGEWPVPHTPAPRFPPVDLRREPGRPDRPDQDRG